MDGTLADFASAPLLEAGALRGLTPLKWGAGDNGSREGRRRSPHDRLLKSELLSNSRLSGRLAEFATKDKQSGEVKEGQPYRAKDLQEIEKVVAEARKHIIVSGKNGNSTQPS